MRVDLLKMLTLLCLLSAFTVEVFAGGVKCRAVNGNNNNYGVYQFSCPAGMLNLGRVDEVEEKRRKIGFSDGFLNGLRHGVSKPAVEKQELSVRHVHSWQFFERSEAAGTCTYLCATNAELKTLPIQPSGFCGFPAS